MSTRNLAERQVGESYKDYASRMAGMARAAELDRDTLLVQREAVLALHHSTPVRFVVGDRREVRNCCAECDEGEYWPCPTAQALGVSQPGQGQAQGSYVAP